MARRLASLLFLASSLPTLAAAEPIRLGSLNAGAQFGTRSDLAARVLARHSVDAWAIGGIQPEWASALAAAASRDGRSMEAALARGRSGKDAVLLLYDPARLRPVGEIQALGSLQSGGSTPVAGRFRDRDSGIELALMAVNFSFKDEQSRWSEAGRVRTWAIEQGVPVVVAGTTNTVDRLSGRRTDPAIEILTDGEQMKRIRPEVLKRQRCNPSARPAVLDFVYLAGDARAWDVTSVIPDEWTPFCAELSPPCCWEPPRCNECGPPHLPVVTELTPREPAPEPQAWQPAPAVRPAGVPAAAGQQVSKAELMEALRTIEAQLQQIRSLVEGMD